LLLWPRRNSIRNSLIVQVIMQMKSFGGTKAKVLLAVLLLGALASESAFAQHRHFYGPRIGFYVGAPLLAYSLYRPYYPPYYYPPYYYPPVAVAPPTYVEQPQFQPQVVPPPALLQETPQVAPQAGSMWYYCNEAKAYYPYVKTCPAGWQQVTPQPQG
jgi:hypothetical protein